MEDDVRGPEAGGPDAKLAEIQRNMLVARPSSYEGYKRRQGRQGELVWDHGVGKQVVEMFERVVSEHGPAL